MAKFRAGRERQLFHGTPGSQAATQIDANLVDVDVDKSGGTSFETTQRGDGSSVIVETEQVTTLRCQITATMRYKDGDTNFAALATAATTGANRAILVKKYASGTTEYDGDCTVKMNSPGPLKDGQLVTFTFMPTDDNGRSPLINE